MLLLAHPFHHIGPVYLRQGFVRRPVKMKAYMCLFVCMVTGASYVQISLRSHSWQALSRFIGRRRGIPESISSDTIGPHFKELLEI